MFDGDGSAIVRSKRNYLEICVQIGTASLALAEGISSLYKSELGIDRPPYLCRAGDNKILPMWRVNIYTRSDVFKFFEYVYQDKGYCYMDRKYQNLKQALMRLGLII
ncbi:hypothetical protein C1N83_00170 [Priestia aryabhattai]